MFRLIKLAMLALFGYAAFEFVRGILQDTSLGARMNDAVGQLTGQGQQGGGGGSSGEPGQYQMSGGGRGEEESTLERDGGSVRHKVGRGVIS
jgi:hypothetical protein